MASYRLFTTLRDGHSTDFFPKFRQKTVKFKLRANNEKKFLVHANKVQLKRPSLALVRFKSNLDILELGLMAVQIELSKFSSLALLRCKVTFKIFELGLIAVHQYRFFQTFGRQR